MNRYDICALLWLGFGLYAALDGNARANETALILFMLALVAGEIVKLRDAFLARKLSLRASHISCEGRNATRIVISENDD